MRELKIIEDRGLLGITFKSDDKEEANTVMRAIQRFILTRDNILNNKKDYSRYPLEGASKNVYLDLFSNERLIECYNNDELEQGYKDYIKNLLNKRGIFDLSMTQSNKKNRKGKIKESSQKDKTTIIDNIKEHELNKKIDDIKKGRDIMTLSDEELEEIALIEAELSSICIYSETAKHILQGRKFNRSRELEDEITKGKRLSELTLEELEKLKEVTMLDRYKEDIQKEIDKRKKESFEEQLQKDNSIISFREDEEEAHYKIDEDPLSSDSNINRWDFDNDGDKVDEEGNKLLFSEEGV
ncbi:hypothetical protein [Brachyspira pilosicoli]|uniref:hypothetical protein n=1 Tax=Brachyspira pilosicoli TaxID=52584 RepID=UPI000E157EDD|nr:hypothetical protein [Brachyspira pilosicoli]SUW04333.1 Uncharacterised protein [Brachyspira pilosicoli]SUW07998.1 Uncharacterised protein [Brachyspira pilosicoli]